MFEIVFPAGLGILIHVFTALTSEPFALLRDVDANRWLLFEHPQEVLQTFRPEEVTEKLRAVEETVNQRGLLAVGFVSYEAAPGFDPALTGRPDGLFPLVWFGLYDTPRAIDLPPCPDAPVPAAELWESSFTPAAYTQAFERIKQWIREGDTYQVNLTYRLRRSFGEDPWPFFVRMTAAQGPTFGAFITTRTGPSAAPLPSCSSALTEPVSNPVP